MFSEFKTVTTALAPRTPLWKLTALPDPLAGLREGKKKEGIGRGKRGREEKGKGGRGRGEGGDVNGCDPQLHLLDPPVLITTMVNKRK